MEVIVFEKEAYYKMLHEFTVHLEEVAQKIATKNEEKNEWLDEQEAKELLGCKSRSKMWKLRRDGEIEYSQHGKVIKYSRKSIMKFFERKRIRA